MYPDPSICKGQEKYYMVCSSFQLFPGVPLFESEDMVNWKQIGHCITKSSQIALEGVPSSGGIFAPTIRFYNGRYYMVTTNDSCHRNFYVYTDDIYGEWSEPVFVEQGGIDPSLFFEGEDAYFISNGADEDGKGCIQICKIDIATGQKLSESCVLWKGTGGRYLEAPHLYRFGAYYYLIEAEGGTEYGHMVNCARSKTIMGEYESCPYNPILTNRNLDGYMLQGAGHGDILEDENGNWWFMHLAFRQISRWETFHHLGRESCLQPMHWSEDGWPVIGTNGTALLEVDVPDTVSFKEQILSFHKTLENLSWEREWCYLRIPSKENYKPRKNEIQLCGTKTDLMEAASPTFIGIRQTEFDLDISCLVSSGNQEAGISLYMDEKHHYEIALHPNGDGMEVFAKATIGSLSAKIGSVICEEKEADLRVEATATQYRFYAIVGGSKKELGTMETRYLSSEVAGGFTGVLIGLYAVNKDESKKEWASFREFHLIHNENAGN